MYRNVLVCLVLLLCRGILAQSQDISFTTINDENGLSNNYVTSVFEDNDGLIWLTTQGGLVRYDGQRFKQVMLPNQQRNIQMDFARQFVNSVIQDQNGDLWLGTLTGLYKYSPKTQKFNVFEHNAQDESTISSNYIGQLIRGNGQLWVTSIVGLNRIDISTGKTTRFLHDSTNAITITNNHVFCAALEGGQLWLGTRGGLDRLDVATGRCVHYKGAGKGVEANTIRAMTFDADSNLWVAAPFEGLFCKYKGSDTFIRIPVVSGKELSVSFSALTDDRKGNLWIGTNGDGLIVLNKRTGHCRQYRDNLPEPYNICSNSIENIFRDKIGNMWVATNGGGISIYKPFKSAFRHFAKNNQSGGLTYNIVSCFVQDSGGKLWIGTDGGGISRKTNDPAHPFQTYDKTSGLTSNAVLAMKEIEPGILAVGTWNGGLNLFDTRTGTFTHHLFPSSRPDAKVQDIYYLHYDKTAKELWCCTYYDGIQVFDVTTRKFIPYQRMAQRFCNWNSTLFCHKMLFEQNGTVWLSEGHGAFKLQRNIGGLDKCADSVNFYSETAFLTDMCQLFDGSIWVTNHKGLYQYSQQADTFLLVTRPGMDFTDAKSVMQDSTGTVWVSTSKSLYRYTPRDGQFQNITPYWGVPTLQYYQRSCYRATDGSLYFGSLKGFVVLHEDSMYNSVVKPRMFVSTICIHSDGNKPDSLGEFSIDVSYSDTVQLQYNQSFITIEFASANYIDNTKTAFKYRLRGFDKDWIDGSGERKATYTNIPPGEYTFDLMCTDSQGNWLAEPRSITVIILPPWWKTWWFISLIAIILSACAVLIVLRREKSITQQNKYLENVVQLKTRELTEKNNALTEQKMTIEESYEKLREKQLVIEIKNSQLQDALNTKDKLLTIIAHDFKNPLSTLQNVTHLLRNKIYARNHDELKQNIDTIANSADSLMKQMVDVLDWSVSSEDTVQFQPAHINIEVLLQDVLLLANETAQQKHISIQTNYDCRSAAYIDPRQMSTVLRNLVINSLKFTPKHGNISISVTENDNNVCIIIADTGMGMNQEQIEAILSDKKLLSNDYQSGIGLQICKTFVSRNKGTFQILSMLGQGSKFIVTVPKGHPLATDARTISTYQSTLAEPEQIPAGKSILIIDDEPDVVLYLREVFAPSYNVFVAYNGLDGLQLAQNHIPDIILSDISMPHIDGKQLCQSIKQNTLTCHIPVILISGQVLPKSQIDGLLHGADDYITKPFNFELLVHKVASIIANRELLMQQVALRTSNQTAPELPPSTDDKIIRDMHSIVMENLTNPAFTVEALAEAVCMSRSQLYRKTKAVLGQTPIEYINNLKFARAMEMILTGKYRVSEIAYELGFNDTRHFSLSFSKKFGNTPSSFVPRSSNIKHKDDE